ncbi:hypothetical protein KBY99_00445 [Cyanobium sp. Maggiore-St4-Cus]|uniref:hypothetical protein n=1 Tax=Cyanobium sp. Maggiore-St4-Cus TaxID=2823717 RepID=UPI0020CD76EB|nr:hypothetical protein [Cyanobium sp. Maggiore-St4-Cus]MCP9787449.1 hypothetical protein [Cyanobium sp. Maggiore-St4-Cus]
MSLSLRTPAISSSGIRAQLIRLLPPVGCPGHPIWVPPNEVQRWEQLGFGRAPIPAADLELNWQPAGKESGGLIPIELLLNPRHTPPNTVTVDWGDGVTETLPWPVGGDGNARLRHGYASRSDYTITAELSGNGITAALLVSLAGCSIWSPEPPAPGPGPTPGPGTVLPLIPGAGLSGAAYDGSTTQQWSLTRWSGGGSAGGVPASDGSSSLFLCADGTWAIPPGGSGGTVWFNGAGPPPVTLSGANPGDYYLDNLSGNFYVLEV